MSEEISEDNQINEENTQESEESSGRNLVPIIIGVWVIIAISLIGVFVFVLNRNPAPSPTTVGSQADAALKPYLDRLKQNPDDIDAMFSIGHILADSKRASEAVIYYEKILKLEADNKTALVDMGAAQLETGEADQAIANIEKALKIQPDFDYGLYVKANYLFSVKKDFQGSLDILKSLEKVMPPGDKLNSVKQNITLVEQQLQQQGSGAPAPAN